MPTPQTDPSKYKTPTPPPSQGVSDEDKALREDWHKLSHDDKDTYFKSLPAEEQVKFAQRVGLFDTGPLIFSAPLKAGTIPWMKEKAWQFTNWGANQLPTVGGIAGGIVGGVLDIPTGAIPGAIAGAGVGGALGEGARQAVRNQTGLDKYDEPEDKTVGARALSVVKQAAGQMAGEAIGAGIGRVLRPTLERSLAKLYYAGGIKYGDPLGHGDLERVMTDLIATEKAGSGKATTVGDFLNVIGQAKKDIGQEVDNQLALPIKQNGRTVLLAQAHADSTPIVSAIQAKATASPSIVKMAQMNPAGKEAVYLEKIRQEALAFHKHPWTYAELTDRRIHLNQELAPIYSLPPGEQRVYLLEHPELAFKKAEAEAIRDIIYPKMDTLSGKPMGTTAELQGKRGALMSIENQVNDHLSAIKTKARQAKGAPPMEKVNISSYGTTGGKPGLAVHRLTGLVHTPNPEAKADAQVAKAFGNTVGTKVRKAFSSPGGSDKLGNEILSMPLRGVIDYFSSKPDNRNPPKDADDDEQSSVSRPKELLDRAKQLNPAAQGPVAYNHTAVNPVTGHKIGSTDGITWVDMQTGAKVA